MASTQPSDIDSGAPPAFSSLRSKFEQLALTTPTKRPVSSHGRLSPDPGSPRPRAVSYQHSQDPEEHNLRSASSSSDLKQGIKRPPPPPPSRKPSSANGSPHLRPTLLPNLNANSSSTSLSRSPKPVFLAQNATPTLAQDETDSPTPQPGGVALMRGKLFSPTAISTIPHTSGVGFSSALPDNNVASTSHFPPAIPPRISKHSEKPRTFIVASPDHIVSHSNSSSRIHSPLSETETYSEPETLPPPLPRRTQRNGNHHTQHSSYDANSGSSSRMSSESDVSSTNRPHSPSPRRTIPPRPPPRGSSLLPPSFEISLQISDCPPVPPPLPIRRNTAVPVDLPPPPPLPTRTATSAPNAHQMDQPHFSSPTSTERKAIGSNKLPPPPTRTIGLGDKLPPARRPPSPSSDEDYGDEDDPKTRMIDLLPDSSRSSRRPPVVSCYTFTDSRINIAAHSGHVAVSGPNIVVATGHHVKGYNLQESDSYMWEFETKELGLKDVKVTSLEVKAGGDGCFVWAGTKEGHLFEMDIESGRVLGMRPAVHAHTVTHIFRHAESMVTVDDTGKVLIWTSDSEEDIRLTKISPRVFRIAEKQEFAKMIGGHLWTSARSDHSVTHGRGPIVRLYDVFSPGSPGRSLLPTEHIGTVTSGTILPSHPDHAYLGHEGGFISVWELESEDGFPRCVEVMKVSASDVLSLEGVNERLWAGGRKGMISAYDVSARPWVVTNSWMAHTDLPVLKLAVDPYSILKSGQMCVVSIGRDEHIRFWDGLLGANWINQELLKREKSFSRFRELRVLLVSWNVDSAKPDSLIGDLHNYNFLENVLRSVDSPDIISFGFQEVIDLENRKMTAKTIVLGKKKGDEGKLLENVTGAYKRWYDHLVIAVRMNMPPDVPYMVVHTEALVGLFTCIFVKNTERASLRNAALATIKRGMGGMYGNKGGIVTRFLIDDSSICLINCHLAAGQHHVRQRNADVAAMVEDKAVFPAASAFEEPVEYVGGGDGSMVLDHEIVFVNGDMNYRLDQRRDHVVAAVHSGDVATLFPHDQLLKEMKFNRGFRFRAFMEGTITFPPTYKYDRGTDEYDLSEKRRTPAWCDRILWRARDPSRVQQLNYQRYEVNVSDHRPVSAGFKMTVKSVRHDVRAKVKTDVEVLWRAQEERLLVAARDFYVEQGMI